MTAVAYYAYHENGDVSDTFEPILINTTYTDEYLGSTGVWTADSDFITVPENGYYLIHIVCRTLVDGSEARLLRNGDTIWEQHMGGPSYTQGSGPQGAWVARLCEGDELVVEGRLVVANSRAFQAWVAVVRLPQPLCIGTVSTADSSGDLTFAGGDSSWLDSGNPERMTVPTTGRYLVSACVIPFNGGDAETTLDVNGSTAVRMSKLPWSGSISGPSTVTLLDLDADDYLSVTTNDGARQYSQLAACLIDADVPAAEVTGSDVYQTPNYPPVIVEFDTEEIDTDAFHDTGTNPGRLTVPTGLDGFYLFFGQANVSGFFISALTGFFNGTQYPEGQVSASTPGTSADTTGASMAMIWEAAEGDYAEVRTFSDNGSGQWVTDARLGLLRLDDIAYTDIGCPGDFVPQIIRRY